MALLETAGLLLGGWLVLAAVRVKIDRARKKNLGSFIYADSLHLWECSNSKVVVTPLNDIDESSCYEKHDKQGNYQESNIVLRADYFSRKLTLRSEKQARRLNRFFNRLIWLREQSDPDTADDDNTMPDLRNLSPEIMGALARYLTFYKEIPTRIDANELELRESSIPEPQKTGQARSGILAYLCVLLVPIGAVLALKPLNVILRDEVIWSNVQDIQFMDERAPWLRAYLLDQRNSRHRQEAQAMLKQIYERTITRITTSSFNTNIDPNAMIPPQGQFNAPPQFPMNVKFEHTDKELVNGLAVVLRSIAAQESSPIIGVSCHCDDDKNDHGLDQMILDKYSLAILQGVGPELIRMAQADSLGLIDLKYHLTQTKLGKWTLTYTVSFRNDLDKDPVIEVRRVLNLSDKNPATIGQNAFYLGQLTAGPHRIDPPPGD